MKTPKRRKFLWWVSAIVLIAGALFWNCLPDPLFNDPVSRVLVDKNGYLLAARIAKDEQWRFPTGESVSQKFEKAIIYYEDKRFFSHFGVDPFALIRAINLNISQNRVVSGASTISMQLIRLSRKNQPRTFLEKLREAILAIRLECSFSKEEILTLYAAHAPFGGNIVGVEAASWLYFGRSPEYLSWAENSFLAILPNKPYSILYAANRDKLLKKRNFLLKRLLNNKIIDALEYKLALLEPIPERFTSLPKSAPHLLTTLASRSKRHRFQSTIDHRLQKRLVSIIQEQAVKLQQKRIDNVSALVIDNKSQQVLAYVGNSQLAGKTYQGKDVDIVQRPRSTGSILKPFLFAIMTQEGNIQPTSLVPDIPSQFDGFIPLNYDRQYRGIVQAKQALVQSLNIPSVYMLKQYGVDRFHLLLGQLGMKTLNFPPGHYGLTLVLGGAEATLWDITVMYSNLAQSANSSEDNPNLKPIRLLMDEASGIDQAKRNPIRPAAAYITLNTMLEVARPGVEGYWKSFASSRKVAWKTGTSFGHKDAWAVGVTPEFTIGVWAGNAWGEGNPELVGISAAAPVLFSLFNSIGESTWFEEPADKLKSVSVCIESGYLPTAGCETEIVDIPGESRFFRVSPYHKLIHLDPSMQYRVDSSCEQISNMKHKTWFILSPGQAYFYKMNNSNYKPLPPIHKNCREVNNKKN